MVVAATSDRPGRGGSDPGREGCGDRRLRFARFALAPPLARWAQYHWLVDAGLLLAFSVGGLMYYLVFFRSKLIPTWLAAWGIGGVVLLMIAAVLIIFDVIGPLSAGQVTLAAPIGVQEMVLATWLIVKGFNPSALAGQVARP